MSLDDRFMGYELAEIERELIFHRRNTGYVRYAGSAGEGYFYLDPSPFKRTPKKEIFFSETPSPEGELVEVDVESEEDRILFSSRLDELEKIVLKRVRRWRRITPEEVRGSKRGIWEYEDFMEYLKAPFTGEISEVERIASCIAIYLASSPPPNYLSKGGVNSAVLGKSRAWTGFSWVAAVIPKEFKKADSEYYYRISRKEVPTLPPSREICLSHHNPRRIPMHIPLVFEEIGVRRKKEIPGDLESLLPLMRAYIIDGLLYNPGYDVSSEKLVVDVTYEIKGELLARKAPPCPLDLGTVAQRVLSAHARLRRSSKIGEKDSDALEIWKDMFLRAQTRSNIPSLDNLYRNLTYEALNLYSLILEMGGAEGRIPESEVRKEFFKKFPDKRGSYEWALEEINRAGLVIITSGKELIALEK